MSPRTVSDLGAEAALAALDGEQRRAVQSPAMPLAVVAPAGSGKTRVLTARLARRLADDEIDPSHVLCVTFTRKAADELRQRLRALGIPDRIEAGTFHAIAWRQLRDRWAAQGRTPPALLDRTRPFLRSQLGLDRNDATELANEITWARARLLRPDHYEAAASGRRTRRPAGWIAEHFSAYETHKRRRHVVDFDDLLAACTSAIEGDPQFAAAQRWRFRHLFVDEFQDVNPLQFGLLEAWRGDRWDVFVVGDTHQSIYGWNGAEPRLLDELASRWPPLETIHLDRTHRSTPQITAAAASVIRAARLPDRHPSSTGAPGPPVRCLAHDDETAEVEAVARAIRHERAADRPWSAFAVLARTHERAQVLERGLQALGVPAQQRRSASILDHPDVRRLLARLRQDDRPLSSAMDVLAEVGDVPDPDLAALVEAAERRVSSDPGMTGRGFAGWASANLTGGDDRGDTVAISTIHGAKGLEWPVVHVVGCEDGSIPIASARNRAARDEEARLLYVAVTRAQRQLTLHWVRNRVLHGRLRVQERSRFLGDFEEAMAAVGEAPPSVPTSRFHELRRTLSDPAPDHPLEVALRVWREDRARAARSVPEAVLSDEALRAIVAAPPTIEADLGSVPGLGASRRARYGDELLTIVAEVRHAGPAETSH